MREVKRIRCRPLFISMATCPPSLKKICHQNPSLFIITQKNKKIKINYHLPLSLSLSISY